MKIEIKEVAASAAAIVLPVFLSLFFLFPASARADQNTGRNAALKAVLKAYIEGRYHWRQVCIGDLALEGADNVKGLPTDIGIIKNPPGRTVFDLDFAGGREIRATADVTAYATVVRAKRLLADGSVIGPGDVYTATKDVARLPDGYFSDESLLIGRLLTRSIGPGVTIVKEMVSACPLVKRGQRVNIVLDTQSFKISTIGRLQRDARVGSYTEVMNVSSRKLLWGVLADENTVRVEAVAGQ